MGASDGSGASDDSGSAVSSYIAGAGADDAWSSHVARAYTIHSSSANSIMNINAVIN